MWRVPGLVILLLLTTCATGSAQDVCTKADFEAVVDDASAALRDLNAKHKPVFQERLRQLKDKRGWTQDVFMREAAIFVQDEKIAEYDQESADFLERINSLGTEGASATTPDCKLLTEVRVNMDGLVAAQKSKWEYMFEKLGKELGP
jgi:hypothetical protein